MKAEHSCYLMAADVGNSAVKLGRFRITPPTHADAPLDLQLDGVYPTVVSGQAMGELQASDPPPKRLEALLRQLPAAKHCWYIASVNHRCEASLSAWIAMRRPQDEYLLLHHTHFQQTTDVESPERVGTDRLAAAVAINHLRSPGRAAIVVDAGTAVTVDLVTSDGVFRGGAILPGIETATRALSAATDALPQMEQFDLASAPSPIGKSTEQAIRSGIVWGIVGAIRELIERITRELDTPPEVFCTGGDGLHLARLIDQDLKFDPNLVLRGIALTGYGTLVRSHADLEAGGHCECDGR